MSIIAPNLFANQPPPVLNLNRSKVYPDQTVEPLIHLRDLETEVFAIPVNTLTNLWLAKYGNEWVALADLHDDEFFHYAYARLRSLGQLETHFLTDRAKYVCRKPL
jgi:hypothetical protein